MLAPMFFILENYSDPSTVGDALRPLVALLFVVKDRGVRGALLSKVPLMTQHLDKKTLNASVFEPLCSGFNDSSPALRELTLKATLNMVPSLNPPSLEKLSRYLIRLQSDTETSIRTNSVIFIAKLASHLSETTLQKMLMPAFTRAMKDTFAPCRLAALQSCLKTKALFGLEDVAVKVLPSVMPLLLDPTANVRKEAFAVVTEFMKLLKEESDKMEVRAQQQQQQQAMQQQQQQHQQYQTGATGAAPIPVPAGSGAPAAPSAAPKSGYLSGLGSWMSSSTKPEEPLAQVVSANAGSPPLQMAYNTVTPKARPQPPVQQFAATGLAAAAPVTSSSLAAADDGWGDDSIPAGDDDGWGDADGVDADDDNWGDDDNDLAFSNIGRNTSTTTAAVSTSAATFSSPASSVYGTPKQFSATPSKPSADPFDDPFASLGMKTTATPATRPGSSKGKLKLPKKTTAGVTLKAKPAAMKLKVDDSDSMGDGWDDF
jgi:SCY1-like protein 1